ILAQLARDVRQQGLPAFRAAQQVLAPLDKAQVSIAPVTPGVPSVDHDLVRYAVAPDGRSYRISYRVPAAARRGGSFAIPVPVLIVGGIAGLAFSIALAWYLT